MKRTCYLLLTGAVLLTACSKKEEVTPPETDYSAPVAAPGYVTCNQEGVVSTRSAHVEFEAAGLNHPSYDWLIIAKDPAPTTTPRSILVIYAKPAGAPDSEYSMYIASFDYNYMAVIGLPPSTITKTSAGWSGTFAGDFTPMKSSITYKLRSGTFTNIK